jgi:hypothetical protein
MPHSFQIKENLPKKQMVVMSAHWWKVSCVLYPEKPTDALFNNLIKIRC